MYNLYTDEGHRIILLLISWLVWSNGRHTGESSVHSKQCAGKDVVPVTGRLLLAELFMRNDSFETEGVERKLVFTSLQIFGE